MKKIIPAILIALTAGLTSCEDAIDKKPLQDINEEDYFKTAEQLRLFTDPLYNNLLEKEPFDEQSDQYVQMNLSQIIIGGNRRQVPESGGGWSWGNLRRCNELLAHLDKCQDAAAATQYEAVTKFFRAFFYFEKIKRFGDVPWYDTPIGSADTEQLMKPRDSRELVMTEMIKDIDFAIENLPRKSKNPNNPYRVSHGAALALKAQFCLYEGTYRKYHNLSVEGNDYKYYLQLAANAAKQIIDEKEYKLYSTNNPSKDYLTLFTLEDANPDEFILAINSTISADATHNANGLSFQPTQGIPGLTRNFINTYLMKDGSRFTDKAGWQTMVFADEMKDRDPRLFQSIRGLGYTRIGKSEVLATDFGFCTTGYMPIKFVVGPDVNNGQVDRGGRNTNDIPVYRFAEVLLNYAEAKAELGTLTQDDLNNSVNLIRKRAGMPNLSMADANANPDPYLLSAETGFTNVTGANAGVILEIRRERGIELLEEGYRINDLFRWKAGLRLNQSIQGMYFPGPGEYDLTGDGKPNLVLYANGTPAPTAPAGALVKEIGKEILLSAGTYGYVDYHKNHERYGFNEARDYLYPIPINERSLNHNLAQNPGWNDGLDF